MTTAKDHAEQLLHQGYVEVEEITGLKVGQRVRHMGEQYSDALRDGTGNIERIFHKENSSWSQKNGGRPDVEVIVKRDKVQYAGGSTHALLANYHVIAVDSMD